MATQFSVTIEDRPGALAELTDALARQAVNILAIHATPCPTQGIAQFIVNNTDATVDALQQLGKDYTTRDVLLVTIPHQPGALAQVARALGAAGININALYITMTAQIVLDVSDLPRAQQLVMGMGLHA